MSPHLIDFLAGAVTVLYFIAGVYFLKFWRRTHDRLFIAFALAFWLFAANQLLVTWLGVADERTGYFYVLRVVGFVIILIAIVGKNIKR